MQNPVLNASQPTTARTNASKPTIHLTASHARKTQPTQTDLTKIHKRAILFRPNETNPKSIWIECGTVEDDEYPSTTYELSQEREWLGGKFSQYDAHREIKPIQRNVLCVRDLPNTLNGLP